MCEKVKTRKYTHLKPLSVQTLKKHMIGSFKHGSSSDLRGKPLGFLIDSWSEDGIHFVAIIAVTPGNKFLLCCSTLEDESDMGADATIELLDDILDTYAIDPTQLCFYVCGHAAVNVAIAKKT
ncbi:Hypothetical protein PHPALM_3533 [Phytophthora palmivora]|uniref:Transposase n=1 Tax=Phytophthora palmivora TaxID=4796 RepID=A0A2P4YM50_9STRA|nr:Hypothetical protein PHPALM_3533 [Phytophthora palmivora]